MEDSNNNLYIPANIRTRLEFFKGYGVKELVTTIIVVACFLPIAFILSKIGGLMVVWWAFPIAEIMSFAVSTLFLFKINKNIISKIPDGDKEFWCRKKERIKWHLDEF